MFLKPKKEGNIEAESRFSHAIERGVEEALRRVRARFEGAKDSKDRLAYHSFDHTRGVVQKVEAMASLIRQADPNFISPREALLAYFAAAFHDVVQRWDEEYVEENGVRSARRKAKSGENEKESAAEAVAFLEGINNEFGEEICTETEKRIVEEAILATVPEFRPSEGLVQKNLTPQSGAVARIVALADLGTAGMDGGTAFKEFGDRLFLELNMDCVGVKNRFSALTDAERESLRTRIIAWSKSQIDFAVSRKNNFEKELEGFPEHIKDAVRPLFNRFDEVIEVMRQETARREAMPLDALVDEVAR